MSAEGQPHTAAVYARLSSEDTDALAVERQREDCRARADREGWTVVAEFAEERASAYSGRRRPEFDRLLAAMRDGDFDVLLVWRLDRLSRNLGDYARAHEAAEAGGVRLVGVADGVDTGTASGEFMANIMFSVARQESRTTGARVSRAIEQSARAGRPHGGRRPFGFEPDLVTQRPDEVAVVREAADRLLAGESLRSVCYDLDARGVTAAQSPRGLSTRGLREILLNPRVAGLRRHRGRDGEAVYPATWEPILERQTWEQVCARLAANGSSSGRAGPGRPATHLLAGLATCGRCGAKVWASYRSGGARRYACVKAPGRDGCGRLALAADAADAEVRDRLLAALASPELADRLAAPDDSADAAARELTAAEDRRDELAVDYAEGTIGRREWLAARDRLDVRVARAQAILDVAAQANVLAGLPGSGEALRARWDAASVEWRRSLLRAVVETVEVAPATRAGPRFDPERLRFAWRV